MKAARAKREDWKMLAKGNYAKADITAKANMVSFDARNKK